MMSKNGPIVLVDDDSDDIELFTRIIRELKLTNQILPFENCEDAFFYLVDHRGTDPFLIISDINLPKVNGLELKKKIDESHILRKKSIPFIFHSTGDNHRLVEEAYEYAIQGFFRKSTNIDEIRRALKVIVDYWKLSLVPKDA